MKKRKNDIKEEFKYKYCYKITCTKGSFKDKIYFGQHMTNDLNDGYKGRGKKLTDYYKKYPNDFIKEIVGFYDTIEELDKAEYDLIHPHLGKDYCLNLVEGGHVNRMCDEMREIISIKTKEAMQSEDIRNKCANGGKKNKGRIVSEEERQRQRDYYKIHGGNTKGKKLWPNGRFFTEEHRANMKRTEEQKEHLHNYNLGARHMNNGITGAYVHPNDIQKYLDMGYVFGILKKSCTKKHKVNQKRTSEQKEHLHNYNLGARHMNNGITGAYVYQKDIQTYLDMGYVFGMMKRS